MAPPLTGVWLNVSLIDLCFMALGGLSLYVECIIGAYFVRGHGALVLLIGKLSEVTHVLQADLSQYLSQYSTLLVYR